MCCSLLPLKSELLSPCGMISLGLSFFYCNPGRVDKKKGDGRWLHTEKISPLQLVETEKYFLRILSGIYRQKYNDCTGDFWWVIIFGYSFINWRVTR